MVITRRDLIAASIAAGAVASLKIAPAHAVSDLGEPAFSETTLPRLRDALEFHEALAARGGWRPLPRQTERLGPGARGPAVIALKERLALTGDLREPSASDLYDGVTTAAMQRFQARHGLTETGRVGPLTLKALNVPIDVRIVSLRASLERVRANGFLFTRRYVVVNIPAASIEAIDRGRVERRHVAVVGRPDRPSPVLEARIGAVTFNPIWTAPLSILRNDIMPRVRQEPGFLATNRMRVFDGQGRELDPATLDWSGRGGINFSLRQDPGPTNALGSIRFDMPNAHAVFIHDTPRQDLFRSDVRFHSSGCARVQDVRGLAEWVLDGSGVDRSDIDLQIETGETRTVRLARSVPVAWVYLTAWAEADGTVQFRDDVYGLDTPDGIITSTIAVRRPVQSANATRQRETQRVSYLDQR